MRAAKAASKFRNIRTNGYASKREAKRGQELKLLQRAGKITDLKEQVKFVLIPKQDGERECAYIADFTYTENGEMIVEDCKGYRTDTFIVKRKLMLFHLGIKILET